MPNKTPNHDIDVGYNLFDPWDYNEEMLHFEKRLVVRDVESNLDDYEPHDGALFIATDTGAVYDGDGSAWNKATRALDALTVDTAPSDPTDVVRLDDLSGVEWDPSKWNVVDAQADGFVGDQTGGDVGQYVLDNGPGLFVFPEGDFDISTTIDVSGLSWSNFGIVAMGRGATFHQTSNSFDTLVITGHTSTPIDELVIKNVDIQLDPTNDLDAGIGEFAANETLVVEDVSLLGRREYHNLGSSVRGSLYGARVNMLGEGSTARMRNIRIVDGGRGASTPRTIPFSVEPANVGTIIWEGCHVANFSNNGYYLKDGTGSSICIGCTSTNIGGMGFRLGQQDVMVGCRTYTNDDLTSEDHTAGRHIEIQRGEGTTVLGHRAIDTQGDTRIIAARDGNEHFSIRDLYVHTTGTARAIAFNSAGDGDDSVSTHGEGMAVIDNARIIVDSDESSASQPAAVHLLRDNCVLNNVSVKVDVPNTSHAALQVESGSAAFNNCRFTATSGNAASYSAIVGDNSGTGPDRVEFNGCEFHDGIYLYGGDTIGSLELIGSDVRTVSTLWPSADAEDELDAGNISNLTLFRNPGDNTQLINGDHLARVTSAWDGSSMTIQAGDDTIVFNSE